jgi:hypothetical protein
LQVRGFSLKWWVTAKLLPTLRLLNTQPPLGQLQSKVMNKFNPVLNRNNDKAHRRQWSAAELPSGAAPCYTKKNIGKVANNYSLFVNLLF